MSRLVPLLLVLIALPGCQRATRYPAAPTAKADKGKTEAKAVWGWMTPLAPPRDLPIRFVSSADPSWSRLPKFWNHFPEPMAGLRTIHIGQSPWAIASTFVLLDHSEAVFIKVPRGLPDLSREIPQSNPPTFGQWKLGRKIFFDRVLTAGGDSYSCADCHQPDKGFTERNPVSLENTRNTLSLINVAFNRHQYWDGRVASLEEVLVESLGDELDASRVKALERIAGAELLERLNRDVAYREQFALVFGVPRVTQDDAAKALATFMRTILSGDSVYDRAVASNAGGLQPLAEHYLKVLDEQSEKDVVARRIWRGQNAFFGKAGCSTCHPAGLFTDHQFHNILIGDSARSQAVSGQETGRFAALPIGLKDPKMRGAYRTPTLRSLSATVPYFHDGSRQTLGEAVDYFAKHLDRDHPLLAAPLRELLAETGVQPALMTPDETEDVLFFLLTLNGQPVDPTVANR